jgi:hypothetical protein
VFPICPVFSFRRRFLEMPDGGISETLPEPKQNLTRESPPLIPRAEYLGVFPY